MCIGEDTHLGMTIFFEEAWMAFPVTFNTGQSDFLTASRATWF